MSKKDSKHDRKDDKKSREYFDRKNKVTSIVFILQGFNQINSLGIKEENAVELGPNHEAANEFIKNIVKSADRQAEKEKEKAKKESGENKSGMSIKFDQDSYSECYPG